MPKTALDKVIDEYLDLCAEAIARGKTKAGSSVAPFHKLSRLHFPLGKTRYRISKGWAETEGEIDFTLPMCVKE